jgi:hypothetical protein
MLLLLIDKSQLVVPLICMFIHIVFKLVHGNIGSTFEEGTCKCCTAVSGKEHTQVFNRELKSIGHISILFKALITRNFLIAFMIDNRRWVM